MSSRLMQLALAINAFRVVPRMLIASYMAVFLYTAYWYTELEEPNTQQTSFISILATLGTGWFGLYVNSGPNKTKNNQED